MPYSLFINLLYTAYLIAATLTLGCLFTSYFTKYGSTSAERYHIGIIPFLTPRWGHTSSYVFCSECLVRPFAPSEKDASRSSLCFERVLSIGDITQVSLYICVCVEALCVFYSASFCFIPFTFKSFQSIFFHGFIFLYIADFVQQLLKFAEI